MEVLDLELNKRIFFGTALAIRRVGIEREDNEAVEEESSTEERPGT